MDFASAEDETVPVSWRAVRVTTAALFVVLLGGMLWALAAGPGAGKAHRAPVGLVGPPVATSMLLESESGAQSESESQIRVLPQANREDATAALVRGDLVVVVLMDLARTEDEVLVDVSRDPDLVRVVVAEVRTRENAFGRTIRTTDVNREHQGRSQDIDLAVLLASLAGFAVGLGAVVARWVHLRPLGGVPRVVVVLIGGALAIGLAIEQWWGPFPGSLGVNVGVLFAIALTSAIFPLAFAAAAELLGMFLALLVLLTLTLPLMLHLDQYLLAQPWDLVFGWTADGAAREALASPDVPWVQLLIIFAWWLGVGILGYSALGLKEKRTVHLPLTRSLLAAAPAVVLIVGCALLLPTAARIPPTTATLASESRCVKTGVSTSVKQLNRVASTLRGDDLFGGGDVGASAQLQDGRSLWLFGDSVRNSATLPDFVRNSMLIFDQNCMSIVLRPDGGAIIPDRRDKVGYWPMSVTTLSRQGYDLVTVSAQRVRATGTGVFDFQALGPSAAVFVVPRGGTPQLIKVQDLTADRADPTLPMWGAAVASHDGWAYLYGTAQSTVGPAFGFSLQVARTRPETALDKKTWQYWDGESWTGTESSARRLIEADGGVSQTLSVWRGSNGTWYALSKRNEFLGSEIVVWTAPGPTGPFTAHPAVGQIPSDIAGGDLRYMPLAHPELLPRKGTVVVSYSNNKSDPDEVTADPTSYRPRFLRVRLPQ